MSRHVLKCTEWHTGKLKQPVILAVVSDLHNDSYADILPMLKDASLLLMPGDLSDRYRQRFEHGIEFLREASRLVPTFVSMGNHDLKQKRFPQLLQAMRESGAHVLCNDWIMAGEIAVGGWFQHEVLHPGYEAACREAVHPQLEGFRELACPKVLMCHKPEHYARFFADQGIELTVAGHAHGGQIRIHGRGLYAPGQGFLPKLTAGNPTPGLIVTTGAGNPARVPRLGNPAEVLLIRMD